MAIAPAGLDMPIGEAMFTQRAIRRLRPEPVPVEDVHTILQAAGKAPSGGNNQTYRFLYVTDPERIRAFGKLYSDSWWDKRRDMEGWHGPEDMSEEERKKYGPAMRLAEDMATAPTVVFLLSLPPYYLVSAIPAAQNLMLAARALGVGTVPTRLHESYHPQFRTIFDVPEEARLLLCIPMGYPQGRFGPTRRRPTSETTYFQSWGATVPWGPDHDPE